jgi:hypothetical protein
MSSRRSLILEKSALEPIGQVTATYTLGRMKRWEIRSMAYNFQTGNNKIKLLTECESAIQKV